MIEISNFLYNLVRGLASHLLSDPETRRNLFPPLPPLNNVCFISFFFLVAFLFIVQYFVRQFSHCAINSFCPNCCVVLVMWVIVLLFKSNLYFQFLTFPFVENAIFINFSCRIHFRDFQFYRSVDWPSVQHKDSQRNAGWNDQQSQEISRK